MLLANHLEPGCGWSDHPYPKARRVSVPDLWCAQEHVVLKPEERTRWLCNSSGLQFDHPLIQIQVQKLTQLKAGSAAKARSCFEFVRKMPFSADAEPSAMTAPEVLRRGRGDTHTKALLFVAMLRALEIPARIRIVTLAPAFLHGLLDTRGRCVSHAISEIYLDDQWACVDAYCADPGLGLAARVRLLREGLRAGYGVHMNGQVSWDGRGHALGHFCASDPVSLPLEDLGVCDDLRQLDGQGLVPREAWATRARRWVRATIVNRRLKALRRSLRA